MSPLRTRGGGRREEEGERRDKGEGKREKEGGEREESILN